jgi:protease II
MLIYGEQNSSCGVTVENTLSGEFVLLKISSTFQPSCNEVWIKSSKDDSKFWLVQAFQPNVRYHIKHSGDFLYKVSNEEDKSNFKVTRIKLPN